MFRARYRKGIWLILAIQLLTAHLWIGYRLPRLAPLWLLGFCVAGGFQLLAYLRFRREALKGMEPVEESWIRNASGRAAEEAGVQRPIPLYCSTAVDTPMILGFHRQVLLIPMGEFEWSELYMIFLHEWTHVKKRDIWYKLIFTAFTCLLWFQPLMYLLRSAAFRDVEVACDERVAAGRSEAERNAYARVLLESLKRKRERELSYSACFTNSKAVMKARISVVLDEGERFWVLGALVLLLLAVETAVFLLTFGVHSYREFRERTALEPLVNIYEGCEAPESFTEQAVEAMLTLTPKDDLTFRSELMSVDRVPRLEYDQMQEMADGPWQLRVEDPDYLQEPVMDFLFRYLMFYEDQERGSAYDPETKSGWTGLEMVYGQLLAGDLDEYIMAVVFREYAGSSQESGEKEGLSGAQQMADGTDAWLYYNWTVHIKRAGSYVCELVGIAETEEVLAAFAEKGVSADFWDFPTMDLKGTSVCRAKTGEEQAEITWDGGESWTAVPIPLEKLFARGDQMEGALTRLQDKSYVVSEEMTAFAYGGDGQIPVTVTCSADKGATWNTSVLTHDYFGTRRLFLSFPDAEHGFLVLTTDRTMWQEASILFRTEDGGATWKEVGFAGPEPEQGHSLTTGAAFVTSEVGFLTIRDSEKPDLWRTADGGETWTKVGDLELREYYGMAYTPEYEEDTGSLKLYVGMEDYSELGGPKCRYISDDLGETWTFDGLVLRR